MKTRGIFLALMLALAATLVLGGLGWYRWHFPYGGSHCCIVGLSMSLQQYAEDHGGKYPAGEATPEACLSLLYRSNYATAYELRGMTVPEKTVRRILEGGGLLGPDTCGWQYVPGLTRGDDEKIAMLWCKTALGHNGDRTRDGGRQVTFLDGHIEWVSGGRWPGFLQEQKELLAQRSVR